MKYIMDDCKTCEKYPSHVNKCTSGDKYCVHFPYEMPYQKRADLKVEKRLVT